MIGASLLCASTERVFTARHGVGIATPSPLQLALLRIIDGRPLGELAHHEHVQRALGGALPTPGERPREVSILGGKRGGKTAILAACAIVWSQTVDTSPLMRGERFRIPIVSLSRDLASQAYHHIIGAIEASAILRPLLVRRPTKAMIEIVHPSGHVCEITVTAGARAGASVAARYLGGAVFDEFPRMLGAGEGVVNWDDMRGECTGRILDGGSILNVGTPWAPFGPAYQQFVERFGKPSPACVVAKAPVQWLNPQWWTPLRLEEYRRDHPDRYVTDVEAEFAAQEEALFSVQELDRATRTGPPQLPPNDDAEYSAAMDPATRGNSWTLVLITREGKKKKVALARQWTGSRLDPISPRATLANIAAELAPYRVRTVWTDQYSADALRELARDVGLTLIPIHMTEKERAERYQALKLRMAESQVELPPDAIFRADLQRIRKHVTQTGISIHLPQTQDGRHCDYAPAMVLAMRRYLDDVRVQVGEPATPQEAAARTEREIHQAFDRERRAAERAQLMGFR